MVMSENFVIHYKRKKNENVILVLFCDEEEVEEIMEAILKDQELDINSWRKIQFSEEFDIHGKMKVKPINDNDVEIIFNDPS